MATHTQKKERKKEREGAGLTDKVSKRQKKIREFKAKAGNGTEKEQTLRGATAVKLRRMTKAAH